MEGTYGERTVGGDDVGIPAAAELHDLALLQSLNQGKALVARHEGDGALWGQLHEELEGAVAAIAGRTGDGSFQRRDLGDRIEHRPLELTSTDVERARSALMALHDRTDEEHAEIALRAVRDLRAAMDRG